MGRAPCCDKANVKRGTWSPDEDAKLIDYLKNHGTGGNWISLPQKAGLKRCGKSCRLRWLNYLRPHIKHGGFTEEEDKLIYSFYSTIGSRWSLIAAHLPGRTDNDVKNHWNTKLKKRFLGGSNTNSSVCPQFSSSTTQPKVETFVFDHNNSADTHVLDLKPTPISPLESDVSVSLPSIPLANETSSVFSNATSLAKEEINEWLGGYYGHEGEGDASILGDSVYEDLLLNGFAFQAKSSQGSL